MDILFQYLPNDLFEQAAYDLLATETDRNILLFTGFASDGEQETDGPVGTYFLSKALYKLGYYPVIISDYHCKGYFDQAEQNFETLLVPMKGFSESFMYSKIIETYDPVALISVERPGRSKDGNYRDMSGKIINGQNAPLDFFFEQEVDILTIGIGDGGNEIGMGKYARLLEEHLHYEAPCSISTHHCLVGTTSNWASYGLIAAMNRKYLPTDHELDAYYEFINNKGAVDGITGLREKTHDGFSLPESINVLNTLKNSR